MSRIDDQYTKQESRFVRAFSTGSTLCAVDCACGRVHFVSAHGHGDYEEGELDRFKKLAQEKPDKYIEHSLFDSIDTCEWGDGYIPKCPCGGADLRIKWIESRADQLVRYLSLFFEDQQKEAEAKLNGIREHVQALAILSRQPPGTPHPKNPDLVLTVDRIEYPIFRVPIPANEDHPDMIGYMVGADDGKTTLSISPEEAVKAWRERIEPGVPVTAGN